MQRRSGDGSTPFASTAVIEKRKLVPPGPAASSRTGPVGASVIVGADVSTTFRVKPCVVDLPAPSVAVHETGVEPSGYVAPEGL